MCRQPLYSDLSTEVEGLARILCRATAHSLGRHNDIAAVKVHLTVGRGGRARRVAGWTVAG